ncbi:glutathione S-transferase N-terminal domain-containing protein [Patescibacteria group bacterium]|nr:glutathione S-transferase N-terminal domain-containing protein [Patescibacteria group bacterium]MBU1922288.1 glutathione S-transferase N-terminal domain-containing protein [Patescibacteria group bacterium]
MIVKVYSTPICAYCIQLKEFLKQKGIEFEEVDISLDNQAAQEMIEKSGQMGVPVVEIDGKMIIGFKKDKLMETLGISE